jgi:hypothetical protein
MHSVLQIFQINIVLQSFNTDTSNRIQQLLKTNKCTTVYCVYSKTRIKTLKNSYMFRSIDHHQGAHVVVELTKCFTYYFNILT